MRYLLNSAVITAPGNYEYFLIDMLDAIKWLDSGEFVSTVGYQETADAIFKITGHKVDVNRQQITMEVSDESLIFRLTKRLETDELKGMLGTENVLKYAEVGILRRTK